MQIYKLNEMKDGWFIGDFLPTAFKSKDFEVCYKKHTKNEFWDKHYHEKIHEINLLVKGKMLINDIELNEGDIFVIQPFYVSKPTFLTDCELIIIKTPSITDDKIIIK
jgi:hypothetical protein